MKHSWIRKHLSRLNHGHIINDQSEASETILKETTCGVRRRKEELIAGTGRTAVSQNSTESSKVLGQNSESTKSKLDDLEGDHQQKLFS